MLRSAIDADYTDKFNIVSNILDTVKMYINPQFYSGEQESKGEQDEYVKKNVDFEYYSRVGHAKGEIKLSDTMAASMKKFYAWKKNPKKGGVVSFDDGSLMGSPSVDDDNVVG